MLRTIRKNLLAEPPAPAAPTELTPAAVLLPLLEKEQRPHILFTKRTRSVKVHKGQVSFPGGVRDPGDENLLATALREAREEIGLQPGDVEILGALEPVATVTTGFLVHTFVGLVPYPYPFRANGSEVAEILYVPFDFLVDQRHWSGRSFRLNNQDLKAYFISYDNYLIWGATARIVKIFLERNNIRLKIDPPSGS